MTIETDYLVVGAGACGMAFVDTLVSRSDADVLLVDRHHRPGGHWNDDYSFVRLHQPSAYYGVDSLPLGADRVDETGPNTGFYERATGAELSDYYGRVLAERLEPTGRVRFLGVTDYIGGGSGEHTIGSLLTGQTTSVRVRKRLVDATFIATSIPSQHKPSFSVEPGVRFIPPNDLVRLDDPGSSFTVIGAGKTSMDTCCWLVDNGVDPGSIRWIRPRDPWTVDRTWMQPLTKLGSMAEWLARQYEAAAVAADAADLMRRFEENASIRRLDPNVEPSVFRGATLSDAERATLARIDNVVRLGRVTHVGIDRIDLERGSVPTVPGEVIVDCSARGLGTPPSRPMFEPDRITIQRVQAGVDPFSAALIGVVEASERTDAEKNRLCPPNRMTGEASGVANDTLITLASRASWAAEPDLRGWLSTTRLSPFRQAAEHMTAEVRASVIRMMQNTAPAIENLQRIVNGAREPAGI
jgi:hypothetical protein